MFVISCVETQISKAMDTKVTLSFNEEIINQAKKYAADNNISLSRLIEFLLLKVTTTNYQSLEDFPISERVSQVAGPSHLSYLKKSKSIKK
jgi:hypothetical protein